MTRIAVIESDDYREEVAALKTDPVLLGMNAELGATAPDMEAWDFVLAASREYNARGGKLARSIGGPARAMRELREEG